MSYLIESKCPGDGWIPFKVMTMPLHMLLDFIHDHFHSEMHTVRFRRLEGEQIDAAKTAVIDTWGKP